MPSPFMAGLFFMLDGAAAAALGKWRAHTILLNPRHVINAIKFLVTFTAVRRGGTTIADGTRFTLLHKFNFYWLLY